MLNYEAKAGSSVLYTDIYDHAVREKENIGTETISSPLLTRAVLELYLGEVRKCRVRRREKKRVWVFSGLSPKNNTTNGLPVREVSYEEDWELLNSNKEAILHEIAPSNWTTMSTEKTTSFFHLEEFRYQKQMAVCEICIRKNDISKKLDVVIQYHERQVPDGKIKELLETLKSCNIVNKTVNLLKIMDKSYTCQGFEICDDEELYEVPLKRYKVTTFDDEDDLKRRAYSPGCFVFTNSRGKQCDSCFSSKKYLQRKTSRRQERLSNGESQVGSNTNHRWVADLKLKSAVLVSKTITYNKHVY